MENRNSEFPQLDFPQPRKENSPMPMTEPRFRNLCEYWTRLPETPRCVALTVNYEPAYSMWSKCYIAIPIMNGEAFTLFSPGTFSKSQLDDLNFHCTGRPDSDNLIARFMHEHNTTTDNEKRTTSATLKAYIKSPSSTDAAFSGFSPIPVQRPDSPGYSRPLLNFLMTVIAPKATDIVDFGIINARHSLRTILYVRNRLTQNTFWIIDHPSAPRKEKTK